MTIHCSTTSKWSNSDMPDPGFGVLMAKVDLKNVFGLCPVQRDNWHLLDIHRFNQYYIDKCLPFGLQSVIISSLSLLHGLRCPRMDTQAPFRSTKLFPLFGWLLHSQVTYGHHLCTCLTGHAPSMLSHTTCTHASRYMFVPCGAIQAPVNLRKFSAPLLISLFSAQCSDPLLIKRVVHLQSLGVAASMRHTDPAGLNPYLTFCAKHGINSLLCDTFVQY